VYQAAVKLQLTQLCLYSGENIKEIFCPKYKHKVVTVSSWYSDAGVVFNLQIKEIIFWP
jgi:hypothetical protein